MDNDLRQPKSYQILSGWKEIANHLGKGVRTVQRYERNLRLPVRRPAGKSSSAVFALTSELDAWLDARPLGEKYELSGTRLRAAKVDVKTLRTNIEEMNRLGQRVHELGCRLQSALEMLLTSLRFVKSDAQRTVRQQVVPRLSSSIEAVSESEPNILIPSFGERVPSRGSSRPEN
jgi:hypothetical protein